MSDGIRPHRYMSAKEAEYNEKVTREMFGEIKVTDLNPEIWDNPTLGAAAQNENLDRVTKQAQEDRSAKLEGREPREVVVDNTYPGWAPDVSEKTGTVPSNYQTVRFADEQQADVPVDSRPEDETAGGLEETTTPEEGSSTESDTSTAEGDSTQWT